MGKTRKRSDGTGSILARSNGTYTAIVTDGTKRRSIGTYRKRDDAEHALAKAMTNGTPPPSNTETLGSYLQRWVDEIALEMKPTTVARNRTLVRCYVLGAPIAKRRICDLKPREFRALYATLADHGRMDGTGLAPASIATVHCTSSQAAARDGSG